MPDPEYGLASHGLDRLEKEGVASTFAGVKRHSFIAVCECGTRVGPCSSTAQARAKSMARELHQKHAAWAADNA